MLKKLLAALGVEPENGSLFGRVYFAFFTSGIMSIMLGTLLPYIRDERALTYSESGLLLSSHQVGNLAAVMIAGILPYALGRRKTAMILGAGTAIGMTLMPTSKSFWLLAVCFALTGVGRGTLSNVCNAVVSMVSNKKTAALNLLHGVFALGALLSPLIVFLCVLNGDGGWKYAAVISGLLALVAWFLLSRKGLSDEKEKKSGGSSFAFLRDGRLWFGTMILFFYLCAEASIIGWFVVYFTESGVLPEVAAQFVPSMLWLMILTGRIICAVLASKVGRPKLLFALSVGVTLCFGGLLFSNSALPCLIFLLGLGLTMGGVYPTAFATIHGTDSTTATGFVIAAATIGAIIMPGIVGAVADSYGLAGGISTVLAALALLLALTAVRMFADKKFKAS